MPPRTKSITELRAELLKKERQLKKLTSRRAVLAKRLQGLDRRILELGGEQPAEAAPRITRRGRKPGRRPAVAPKAGRAVARRKGRAGKPLLACIRDVLKGSEGMRVKDIAQAVRKAGYKTVSKDFYSIVAATVRDTDNFKKLSRGVYKLA